MAVTPQTNTDLAGIAAALADRDDFVICGHVSPDGDCIGSQLALMHALRQLGKSVTCLLAKDEPVEPGLRFLPGVDGLVPAASYTGPAATFVAVDVPTPERLGEAANALREAAGFSVTVDHHAVEGTMSDLNYVDPDAAACALLVWELAGQLGSDRAGDIAVCAYTGLMTDTGRFQYQNADAAAFAGAAEMAAAGADPARAAREVYQNRRPASLALEGIVLGHMRVSEQCGYVMSWLSRDDFERTGACKADAEPLIDVLRSLAGVRVACMLREQAGEVRGSFRAKDGTDVARLARRFGGGGHKAAAGFTMQGPVDAAAAEVAALLDRELCGGESAPGASSVLGASDAPADASTKGDGAA